MTILLVDLRAQYKTIKDEIDNAIKEVIERAVFASEEYVRKFENEFAGYCGRKYGVGTSSGSTALDLTLIALGIGEGDEVITTPNTFIATSEAITHAGARCVFCDCEEESYNIDPDEIKKKITKKTKAIIPVDLFGQPPDMDRIFELANEYNLYIIEDAAQAHGSRYKDKPCGSFGVASCFSFYPSKNLGAYGHAGMVVTDDEKLAKKIRLLANHGREERYEHIFEGYNFRMDDIQAAILLVKLRYIDEWNRKRREVAKTYNELLKDIPDIILPKEMPYAYHVYHLYVIRTKKRDELQKFLREKGIITIIHYPIPLHLQPAYSYLGYKKGDFPVAERCTSEVLSLPMYPELTRDKIEYIVDAIKEFFS